MKLFVSLLLAAGVCLSPLASSSLSAGSSSRQRIVKLAEEGKQALANRQLSKALEFYHQALNLSSSSKDYLTAAALHNLLGEVYEDTLGYQYALAEYETGERILRKKSVDPTAISAIDSLDRMRMGTKAYMGSAGAPVSIDLYRGEIKNLRQLLDQLEPKAYAELVVLLNMNAGNMYLQQR